MFIRVALAAKESMGMHKDAPIVALADKGYFNAEQLQRCSKDQILTYVPQTYNHSQERIPVMGYHPAARLFFYAAVMYSTL